MEGRWIKKEMKKRKVKEKKEKSSKDGKRENERKNKFPCSCGEIKTVTEINNYQECYTLYRLKVISLLHLVIK